VVAWDRGIAMTIRMCGQGSQRRRPSGKSRAFARSKRREVTFEMHERFEYQGSMRVF
jgi:hypothetical protein